MIRDKRKAEENVNKYLKPPTWEEIDSFVKEVGVSIYHFEKYYNISFNHLAKVRCGLKQLGKSYWHIFYERIVPTYGLNFDKNQPKKTIPKVVTKVIPNSIPNTITHKRVAYQTASVAYQPDNPTNVVDTCDKSQDEHDRTQNLK